MNAPTHVDYLTISQINHVEKAITFGAYRLFICYMLYIESS